MKMLALFLPMFFAATMPAFGQTEVQATSFVVKAAKVLDVHKGSYIENAAIWMEGESIKEVGPALEILAHAPKAAVSQASAIAASTTGMRAAQSWTPKIR